MVLFNLLRKSQDDGMDQNNSDSVIKSILSQVKQGGDLQRLSLPPVTLKPLSFLETLAINSTPSTKLLSLTRTEIGQGSERMVGVVTWLLENMSDTPQYSLKRMKPTNPLLGETFSCDWIHNADQYAQEPSRTRCISEQVSHHPPVSALFWENTVYGLKYLQTAKVSSNFFVKNLDTSFSGEQILHMVNLNESYSIRLPVIRSKIALIGENSVSWNGEMEVDCRATQTRAFIKFSGFSSFVGTVEKIVNHRRIVVAKIQGDLQNDINIIATQTSDLSYQTKTVLLAEDIQYFGQLVVPPPDQTLLNDSRVVWGQLFQALNSNNMEQAAILKNQIEEQQRIRITQNAWDTPGVYRPSLFAEEPKTSRPDRPVYRYCGRPLSS